MRSSWPSAQARQASVGTGQAHAAIGILNATATGVGCSLAITGKVTAEWTWHDGAWEFEGCSDDRLARAVAQQVRTGAKATVRTASTFPPSRGLKTSSSAALAMVRAARTASDPDATPSPQAKDLQMELEVAIAASHAAGVTLTGAFDDQVAVQRGGCHLTDNPARLLLASPAPPPWHVAVWVPIASIPKAALRCLDATVLGREVAPLADQVRRGDLPGALTRSGAAFTRLYAAAGFPVTSAPAEAALEHGALGAGLSGTGPAVGALFERRTDLPEVPGGTWQWFRAVEADA